MPVAHTYTGVKLHDGEERFVWGRGGLAFWRPTRVESMLGLGGAKVLSVNLCAESTAAQFAHFDVVRQCPFPGSPDRIMDSRQSATVLVR